VAFQVTRLGEKKYQVSEKNESAREEGSGEDKGVGSEHLPSMHEALD
jgi:hypothetical protein